MSDVELELTSRTGGGAPGATFAGMAYSAPPGYAPGPYESALCALTRANTGTPLSSPVRSYTYGAPPERSVTVSTHSRPPAHVPGPWPRTGREMVMERFDPPLRSDE